MTLSLDRVALTVGADPHLHPTSLTLEPGRFTMLLGTTLAGKTTLLQLMAGLIRPSSGRILAGSRDVTRIPTRRRNVALVHQQFVNYPNLSVFDNIASPLRVAGVAAAEIQRRVGQVAELLRLTPLLDRRPQQLSGGQQQRTALARALVKEADLVLLDEPLANLDFKLREELREELPRLFRDRGSIIAYATTEPMEALLLGGDTACLHEGRVTHFGPTAEIYRRPPDLLTAQVLSDPPINLAPVLVSGGRIRLEAGGADWALGALPLAEGRYTLGIRPHHVHPAEAPARPGLVPIQGRVLVTELSGSESTVHFAFADRVWVSLAAGIHPHPVGEQALFRLDPAHVLVYAADGRLAAAAGTG